MSTSRRELTAEQARQVTLLEIALRGARMAKDPHGVLSCQLRVIELERTLGELRGAGEPFGTALLETILADGRAGLKEAEAARDASAEAERTRAEKADIADAVRQAEALDADGGPSDMTIAEWLAHVRASFGGETIGGDGSR